MGDTTYGILIFMNARTDTKDTITHATPRESMIVRVNLVTLDSFTTSSVINPTAPSVNIKLHRRPSIMYWLFIRHCMNAT